MNWKYLFKRQTIIIIYTSVAYGREVAGSNPPERKIFFRHEVKSPTDNRTKYIGK